MRFLGERERPLCHQEAQEASKWDLSPFCTKNLSGFQSSAELQKFYQWPGTSILLREQVWAEVTGKNRFSSEDNMSPFLHAALSCPLRSACAGHRHPLPHKTSYGASQAWQIQSMCWLLSGGPSLPRPVPPLPHSQHSTVVVSPSVGIFRSWLDTVLGGPSSAQGLDQVTSRSPPTSDILMFCEIVLFLLSHT